MSGRQRPAFTPARNNLGTAMRRNAERRRCPKCGRGAALTWVPDVVWDEELDRMRGASVCRWPDCRWDSAKPRPAEEAG